MEKKQSYKGLFIIAKYLGEFKKELIVLSVLGVISALANGVVPYLVGRIFDAILDPSAVLVNTALEMPLWLFFIILWGVTQAIVSVIDWQVDTRSGWMGEAMFSSYTIKGFSRLLEMPVSFHANQKMGKITSAINRVANTLYMMTDGVILRLTPQFLSLIVALVIVFLINITLASILSLGAVVYIVILMKTAPPLVLLQEKMDRAYGKAFGGAYDAVFNARAIKQAVSEKNEQKKFFKNFRLRAAFLYNKMTAIWQELNFYQRLITALTQLIVFAVSIFFIQQGTMTIGELVMFNGYAAMLFGPFAILGRDWQTIQNGMVMIEQNEKVMTAPIEDYEPENAVILSDIKGEVEFKNVDFAYRAGQPVLKDISFKASPGEVIALVGESGVGKSTLIDLISGYYFAKKGKVLIGGRNIKRLKLRFLRSKIAIVPQEVVLFNDTIKTNIKYGTFGASDEQIEEAARKANCLEFVEKFPKKWKQIVGERGVKLSVGQKQRVAIARAILRDPKILILDEPTSALDAKAETVIQEALAGLMKGRTTFIIAHRLSTVRRADKILVLENGRIVEEGKHEDLIKKEGGVYRNLYELQMGLQ